MHARITAITELAVEAKLPQRKRESQHYLNGCNASRN
jgi:hypothetical protein